MGSSAAGVRNGSASEETGVRRWALIGGIGILLIAAVSVFANFIVLEQLVTPGDPTATAKDIASSKGLFQAGVAGWFLIAALDVFVAVALFLVVRPVSRRLAAVAAWSRALYGVVLGVASFQLLSAAGALGGRITTSASNEVLQKTDAFTDIWNVGLILFGIHLMLVGYLAYRSGYMPRFVGVLTGIAGFGYVFDAAVRVVVADAFSLSVLTGLGEFVLGVWLVSRGRRIALQGTVRQNREGAGTAELSAA